MKQTQFLRTLRLLTALVLLTGKTVAAPVGTAFTYQGRLNDSGNAATGIYDLRFTVYDALAGGNAVGSSQTNAATPVTNGLFATRLDFGPGIFTGDARWLELAARTNGGADAFEVMTPRNELTPAPSAQFASNAATAATLSGTVTLAQLPAEVVANNATNVTLGGAFSGNGAGLTNVSAATLGGQSGRNFWQLGGNSASPGQFLGTTNTQALELWAGNQRAVRLEANSSSAPNFIAGASVNFAGPGVVGATIAGGGAGYTNSVTADYGTVAGGGRNSVNGMLGMVGGGFNNSASSQRTVISGGMNNKSDGFGGVVAGGVNNTNGTGADYGTVSGGYNNNATGTYSSVGGGLNNVANGMYAAVGGGNNNKATNQMATVAGGGNNTATTFGATVAGGLVNVASGMYATVGGGNNNTASAQNATVAGGFLGQATNSYATVAGGSYNLAGGQNSFAAGRMARAQHDGSFVWADSSVSMYFNSISTNEFAVRAAGGVRLVTSGAGLTLDGQPVVTGQNTTNFWQLGGNNVSPGQFLGSTNNQPLDLWADGSRGLRLQHATVPSGLSASYTGMNVIGGYAGNYVNSGTIGATIAGGGYSYWNSISGTSVYTNSVFGNYGTVCGGYNNTAETSGTVAGGYSNIAGSSGVVGGGHDNMAGAAAVVPGGNNNRAIGYGSLAAGINANAAADNSFVWSDGNVAAHSSSTGSFDIFAAGGMHINRSDLYLGITNDLRHGLGYRGTVGGTTIDGPFLYGNSGGALGATTPTTVALKWDSSGNVTIGNAIVSGDATIYGTTYLSALWADGDATCFGNVWIATNCSMASLTIRGGADLAEPFNITSGNGEVPEGAVVVIDEQHAGRLKMSNKPYDTHVAGVVSGANGVNPGIQMH